jgi:hypothetical protein
MPRFVPFLEPPNVTTGRSACVRIGRITVEVDGVVQATAFNLVEISIYVRASRPGNYSIRDEMKTLKVL